MSASIEQTPSELQDFDHEATHGNEDVSTPALSLPRADTGIAAWLFLAGSFTIEMLLWGFPFSFGVLQDYYSTHLPFSSHPEGISAVGTTCSGLMYLGAPLCFLAFQRWPRLGRRGPLFGLPIIVLGVLLSSYASQMWHLILTQGILYAIGGNLLYYPIFIYIDEWFIRRKGFAFGVMWAGSGCGGLAGPLVLHWGLGTYGVEKFLRGWSIALLLLIGPFLYFVKPRLPLARDHRVSARAIIAGFGFLRTGAFWAIQLGNIMQGLGYFVPLLYLPNGFRTAYTRLHHSKSGSLFLSLLNTASVPGVVVLSALSDKVSVFTVILISALGSALSIFLLWGLSSSTPGLLIAFALCYGFFGGGFTATYAGTARELRHITPGGDRGRADLGSILGLLSVGRGIGNVICGPVSEALLHTGAAWSGAGAYGGLFGPLIVFTGSTATLAMGSWLVRSLKLV